MTLPQYYFACLSHLYFQIAIRVYSQYCRKQVDLECLGEDAGRAQVGREASVQRERVETRGKEEGEREEEGVMV